MFFLTQLLPKRVGERSVCSVVRVFSSLRNGWYYFVGEWWLSSEKWIKTRAENSIWLKCWTGFPVLAFISYHAWPFKNTASQWTWAKMCWVTATCRNNIVTFDHPVFYLLISKLLKICGFFMRSPCRDKILRESIYCVQGLCCPHTNPNPFFIAALRWHSSFLNVAVWWERTRSLRSAKATRN